MAHTQTAWIVLQKRIFTRWVKQKLAPRNVKMEDLKTDFTPEALLDLIEILSGKQFTGKKLNASAKTRVHKIDNAARAIAFAESCGVTLEVKTSAENFIDGEEKPVLGLIWGIMRAFMKFGDDKEAKDSKQNAKDALQKWFKGQVESYAHVDIKDMTKSFHDGMALCALIHKFRPKLIDYNSLDPKNRVENLKLAFSAAHKLFGLEEYITPNEFFTLDEKSMVVYLSEYYSGIARFRKIDIAARRIAKLIRNTLLVGQLKDEYIEKAKLLKDLLIKANTMFSSIEIVRDIDVLQKRIEELYEYQTKDKTPIFNYYLSMEAAFNQLNSKLAESKRPAFIPPEGYTLAELSKLFAPLEKWEAEKNEALHKEYYILKELVRLNKEHVVKFDKLSSWAQFKLPYLQERDAADSSGTAEFHLNRLKAYDEEVARNKTYLTELLALGEKIKEYKYEKYEEVQQREEKVKKAFEELDQLYAKKLSLLQDDLIRESLKEKIELLSQNHFVSFGAIKNWLEEKENYLKKRETVESVRDARVQIDTLRLYYEARAQLDASFLSLKEIGKDILTAHHDSPHSKWTYSKPQEIKDRETYVEEKRSVLDKLYAEKERYLNDDLEREEYKEKVALSYDQHGTEYTALKAWIEEKRSYLTKRDSVNSVSDAIIASNTLDIFEKAKMDISVTRMTAWKKIAKQLFESKYESKFSNYTFDKSDEIKNREASIDQSFAELDNLAIQKKQVLADELAREEYKEKILLLESQHRDRFNNLKAWIEEKEVYLRLREEINTVREAREQLNKINVFEKTKSTMTQTNLGVLQQQGKEIIEAKYKTNYSEYTYPHTDEIKQREAYILEKWPLLDQLRAEKLLVIKDVVLREEYREKILVMDQQHLSIHGNLKNWIEEKTNFFSKRTGIDSVRDAKLGIHYLSVYEKEKQDMSSGLIQQFKKMGKEIVEAKYESKYSVYVFPTPQEIKSREDYVEERWSALDKLYLQKQILLKDDLAREEFKEQVFLDIMQHNHDYQTLQAWIDEKKAYLERKETTNNVRTAHLQLNLLSIYEKDKAELGEAMIPSLKKLGAKLLQQEYKSEHSSFSIPNPEDITNHEKSIDEQWILLDQLAAKKLILLKDDLSREEFAEKVVLKNQQHSSSFVAIKSWCEEKQTYLERKEELESVRDVRVHLNSLSIYEQAAADLVQGNIAVFNKLGQEIIESKFQSEYSSYVFPKPDEVKERETFVKEKMAQLSTLSAAKNEILKDSLIREEYREKILVKNEQHLLNVQSLKMWIEEKVKYLDHKEEVKNIADAKVQLNLLDVFSKEKANTLAVQVAGIKKTGQEVLEAKYESRYCSWVFNQPQHIKEREAEIDEKWKILEQKYTDKKIILDKSLHDELEKEKQRITYANLASEAVRACKDINESLKNTNFGFTLAQVELFASTLTEKEKEVNRIMNLQTSLHKAYDDAKALGVTEEQFYIYSETKLDELDKMLEEVKSSHVQFKSVCDNELAKQREHEQLCKRFADLAIPFSKHMQTTKENFENSELPEEKQIELLKEAIATAEAKESKTLAEIKELQKHIDELNISVNPYTLLTSREVDVQWQQYISFLPRRKKQLEEFLTRTKYRGLTPDQMQEINAKFIEADTSGNKLLSVSELKQCLYALGNDFDVAEVKKIMLKFGGNDTSMDYEGFMKYMVSIYAETDSKEDVIEAFKFLNNGAQVASLESLQSVLTESEIVFFKEHAQPKDKGYDFIAFTDKMFEMNKKDVNTGLDVVAGATLASTEGVGRRTSISVSVDVGAAVKQ